MNEPGKAPAGTPPTPTPFSRALTAAIKDSGRSHEDIAEAMGVTPGLVSAWVTARKPVPARRALPLSRYLGCSPEAISADFAAIAEQDNVRALPGSPSLDPDLERSRLENDIDALRYVVSALVSVAIVHRPVEAAAVGRALRQQVPARFLEQGYLGGQLAILESAVDAPKAAVPATSRRPGKR